MTLCDLAQRRVSRRGRVPALGAEHSKLPATMALDLQFGLEEYAGAFATGEDGALAVSSGRQGRAYVVSAAKLVDLSLIHI